MQMILGGSIFPQSLQDNPSQGALSKEFPKLYVANLSQRLVRTYEQTIPVKIVLQSKRSVTFIVKVFN